MSDRGSLRQKPESTFVSAVSGMLICWGCSLILMGIRKTDESASSKRLSADRIGWDGLSSTLGSAGSVMICPLSQSSPEGKRSMRFAPGQFLT
jgi:hypothetical protein